MKSAREAGVTVGELYDAIKMAEKVRDVQVRKTEKFSRKVSGMLAELNTNRDKTDT